MHIRPRGPALPSPIPDTFELTETLQGLMEAVHHGVDTAATLRIARKAMSAAEHAAWRIREQSRQIAELERDSVTDPLTGVLNRRGFEAELARALADGRRYDEHGALLYLDLDGFKEINDTLGHAAGDAVLRKFASILVNNVRDTDRVGRLGGDEFAILMSRTSLANAAARAEKIEWLINASAIDWSGQVVSIRASLGTDYFGPDDDSAVVMLRADQAMYRQKQEQRRHPRHAARSVQQSVSQYNKKNDHTVIPITTLAARPAG